MTDRPGNGDGGPEAQELPGPPPRLAPVVVNSVLVAAARLAIAALGLGGAAARIGTGAAFRQLALGAALLAFALFFGRSRQPLEAALAGAVETPANASAASPREGVVAALFPSSVGVGILTAAALVIDARLAAILAGLLAAMGFAALVSAARVFRWERLHRVRVLADRRSQRLFVTGRPEVG